MANTFTDLDPTIFAQMVMQAFGAALLPFQSIARSFTIEPGKKGQDVEVPWVDAAADPIEKDGDYVMQDTTAEGKKVTLQKPFYVSWGLSDWEKAIKEGITTEMFATRKGYQLARGALLRVFSQVTLANFGAAAFTGASTTWDRDEVVALSALCDTAEWPDELRTLVLNGSFYSALELDDIVALYQNSGSDETMRTGRIPSLSTFQKIFKAVMLPNNSENLAGFALHPDALLVAMRYHAPGSNHDYNIAEPMINEQTGVVAGYRNWYSKDAGEDRNVLEVVMGTGVGNPNALKRIVTA